MALGYIKRRRLGGGAAVSKRPTPSVLVSARIAECGELTGATVPGVAAAGVFEARMERARSGKPCRIGMLVCGPIYSLQLRVLRLGLLQDGDVGVGIFPEGKKILIGGAGFGRIPLKRVGASKAELRQRT